MRIHCKLLALVVCFGVFLLLYFLGGNAADDPPLKEVQQEQEEVQQEVRNSLPAPPEPGHDAAAKSGRKPSGGVAGELLRGRKEKTFDRAAKSKQRGRPAARRRAQEVMHLAVVACGSRLDETLTMIKSTLLFSFKKIRFHIFAEDPLTSQFAEKLNQWPRTISAKFQYSIYPITFSVGNAEEWKKLFKPCAAQRLFLPVILKDVDSLLYVDTDVLFLRPMDDIWNFLKSFNSSQLAAMAPEHEVPKIGWYSRFARHPFYGVTGVNSGVMLMNLTRIRSTLFKNSMISSRLSWEDLLHPLYQKYKNHITWGDQDLLNIIFHDNPGTIPPDKRSRLGDGDESLLAKPDVSIVPAEDCLDETIANEDDTVTECDAISKQDLPLVYWNAVSDIFQECLFILPCQWNYRPDHCMYGSNCKGAEEEGVSILHGNRGVYHDDKQPAFKVVYDAIHDFPFEHNMFQSLFYPIQTKFLDTVNTLCGRIPQVFLKQIEKTMRKAFEDRVVHHIRPHK